MANELTGKRVAILVSNGFEQSELLDPRKALDQAGAITEIISPEQGKVKGWNHTEWGEEVQVDRPIDVANAGDYDALLLPGGVMNPDHLRLNNRAVQFVKSFFTENKPVAAICHGPDEVRGRTITSWPSIKTDIRNAGGNWVDREVVVDNGLVTSRKPADIPAFNRKMIEEFGEGKHLQRKAS